MEKWGKILMWAGAIATFPFLIALWGGLESRKQGWTKCSYWN